MKKLFAALLLSFPLAASANMMVMKNQQGGHIILGKDECPIEADTEVPMFMAVATAENVSVPGCWYFNDMKVHIFWFEEGKDPVKYEYPALNFEFVPSDQEKK